ncbi:MAG TPA: class I SAM-dependent methyltransferase [archaeon]|nr:class I SAM-dependent methyltransferase [archaeon]
MRPEIMTSIQLARWLYSNQGLYRNKSALDMGCGSGIQGVVMAIFGSKKVVLSDVSKDAVANSKENIKKYELENQCTVFESDLFENIEVSFDIIVFNHPFFGDIYKSGEEAAIEMLGGKTIIHRFFDQAKLHLNKNGTIVMPFFSFGRRNK